MSDEPSATCGNCEYFDGGGLGADGAPINWHGDCHNSASPHFSTNRDGGCAKFFPSSTRWPGADHD